MTATSDQPNYRRKSLVLQTPMRGKARGPFEVAAERRDDLATSREIGGLLGKDLTLLFVNFARRPSLSGTGPQSG